jgi:hypothetical protein
MIKQLCAILIVVHCLVIGGVTGEVEEQNVSVMFTVRTSAPEKLLIDKHGVMAVYRVDNGDIYYILVEKMTSVESIRKEIRASAVILAEQKVVRIH